jgi:hypothetical protein
VGICFFENSLDLVASGIDRDAEGIGEFVRWMSETVSTVELASVLRARAGVQDASVALRYQSPMAGRGGAAQDRRVLRPRCSSLRDWKCCPKLGRSSCGWLGPTT